jgi:hypothetical protein
MVLPLNGTRVLFFEDQLAQILTNINQRKWAQRSGTLDQYSLILIEQAEAHIIIGLFLCKQEKTDQIEWRGG